MRHAHGHSDWAFQMSTPTVFRCSLLRVISQSRTGSRPEAVWGHWHESTLSPPASELLNLSYYSILLSNYVVKTTSTKTTKQPTNNKEPMTPETVHVAAVDGTKNEISFHEFENQVKAGEIQAIQMVWHTGRDVWARADVAFPNLFIASTEKPPLTAPSMTPVPSSPKKPVGYAPSGRVLAHPGMRLIGLLLDALICSLVIFAAMTPVLVILTFIPVIGWILEIVLCVVGPFIIGLAYMIYLPTSKYEATLGQLILGMRMENSSGDRISVGQATGRYFGSIISLCVFILGYLWGFLDERAQTWHDKWSGTFVVMK